MGQKVNPLGFRIGIRENWRSRWYAAKKPDFSQYLLEDQLIRKFLKKEYGSQHNSVGISCIEIERTTDNIKVIIHAHKPGFVIGHKGSNIQKISNNLSRFVADKKKQIDVEIKEVTMPEVVSQLVAENIGEQLIKRANFRRTMKKAIEEAHKKGVLGIKIQISGRLSGAEMARTESAVEGKVPLQTLDAHIDYGFAEALTTYGLIGIKVWIYLGEYGKEITNVNDAKKGKISKKPARQS